jgi:hypothetical protein
MRDASPYVRIFLLSTARAHIESSQSSPRAFYRVHRRLMRASRTTYVTTTRARTTMRGCSACRLLRLAHLCYRSAHYSQAGAYTTRSLFAHRLQADTDTCTEPRVLCRKHRPRFSADINVCHRRVHAARVIGARRGLVFALARWDRVLAGRARAVRRACLRLGRDAPRHAQGFEGTIGTVRVILNYRYADCGQARRADMLSRNWLGYIDMVMTT